MVVLFGFERDGSGSKNWNLKLDNWDFSSRCL